MPSQASAACSGSRVFISLTSPDSAWDVTHVLLRRILLKVALLKSEVCSNTHGSHHAWGMAPRPSHVVDKCYQVESCEWMTLYVNNVLCHGKWCHRLYTIPLAYDSEWCLYPLWQTRFLWNMLTAGKTLGSMWCRGSTTTTTTTTTWLLYLSHTEKDTQDLRDHRSSNIIHTSEVICFQGVSNSTGYGTAQG